MKKIITLFIGLTFGLTTSFVQYKRVTVSSNFPGGKTYSAAADPFFEVDHAEQMKELPFNSYTPLFIDLIDNFNQSIYGGGRPTTDIVSGFQINYLQNVLIQRPTNWYMYRDFIQANPPVNGVTNFAAGIQLFSDYD
jgi:hypothetical protein